MEYSDEHEPIDTTSYCRTNAAVGDFIYHMTLDFFGFVSNITISDINGLPYYTIKSPTDLNVTFGSYMSYNCMTASRI